MKFYQVDTLPEDYHSPGTKEFPNRRIDKPIPSQTPFPNRAANDTKDPLIASGWEKVIYILSFLIFVGVVILLGFINRKIEYAVMFAIFISVVGIILIFSI